GWTGRGFAACLGLLGLWVLAEANLGKVILSEVASLRESDSVAARALGTVLTESESSLDSALPVPDAEGLDARGRDAEDEAPDLGVPQLETALGRRLQCPDRAIVENDSHCRDFLLERQVLFWGGTGVAKHPEQGWTHLNTEEPSMAFIYWSV